MVHCYETFQKLPQKVDNDVSILHCETENNSLLASAKKNSERKKQIGEEFKLDEESDSSDDLACLVANESIRVATYSPLKIG